MSVRPKHNPPVNLRTGQVSARIAGCAILRPLSGGGYLGFENPLDAYGHPTTTMQPSVEKAA